MSPDPSPPGSSSGTVAGNHRARAPVYHFTDSINLPWILASGELRPCRISDAGIGTTWFLWATANPLGDYTAGPFVRIHGSNPYKDPLYKLSDQHAWQNGEFHLVRFTLDPADFLTWNEIVRHWANWTPDEVATLIESDQRRYGEYGHHLWRLRHDPLPLNRVLKGETTSYADRETERWWTLDINRRGTLLRPNDSKRKGVKIGRRRFYSVPVRLDHQFYRPWTPPAKRRPCYIPKRKRYVSEYTLDGETIYC